MCGQLCTAPPSLSLAQTQGRQRGPLQAFHPHLQTAQPHTAARCCKCYTRCSYWKEKSQGQRCGESDHIALKGLHVTRGRNLANQQNCKLFVEINLKSMQAQSNDYLMGDQLVCKLIKLGRFMCYAQFRFRAHIRFFFPSHASVNPPREKCHLIVNKKNVHYHRNRHKPSSIVLHDHSLPS